MNKWTSISKLVLASNNQGKLAEFQRIFSPLNIDVIPQKDFAIVDAEETGLSFVENAIIKARHASKLSGLPALADDSGLEVDALQGAPGIYSARYSGQGTDKANNEKLLQALENTPSPRTARFQCVLALMLHGEDPTPLIAQGSWEGEILTAAQGEQGFGYDPLFYVPSEQCTSAQLERSRKNALSHRGVAVQQLLRLMEQ